MDQLRLLEERQALLLAALHRLCAAVATQLPNTHALSIVDSLVQDDATLIKQLFLNQLPKDGFCPHTEPLVQTIQAMLRKYHQDKLIKLPNNDWLGVPITVKNPSNLYDEGVLELYLPVVGESVHRQYSVPSEFLAVVCLSPRERRVIALPFEAFGSNTHSLRDDYSAITGEDLVPTPNALLALWDALDVPSVSPHLQNEAVSITRSEDSDEGEMILTAKPLPHLDHPVILKAAEKLTFKRSGLNSALASRDWVTRILLAESLRYTVNQLFPTE